MFKRMLLARVFSVGWEITRSCLGGCDCEGDGDENEENDS